MAHRGRRSPEGQRRQAERRALMLDDNDDPPPSVPGAPVMRLSRRSPYKRKAVSYCDGVLRQGKDGNVVTHTRYLGRGFCPMCGRPARRESDRVDVEVGPWIDEYLFPDAWGQSATTTG